MSQGHGVVAQDSWKLKGVAQDWGQAWCVDSGQVALARPSERRCLRLSLNVREGSGTRFAQEVCSSLLFFCRRGQVPVGPMPSHGALVPPGLGMRRQHKAGSVWFSPDLIGAWPN